MCKCSHTELSYLDFFSGWAAKMWEANRKYRATWETKPILDCKNSQNYKKKTKGKQCKFLNLGLSSHFAVQVPFDEFLIQKLCISSRYCFPSWLFYSISTYAKNRLYLGVWPKFESKLYTLNWSWRLKKIPWSVKRPRRPYIWTTSCNYPP